MREDNRCQWITHKGQCGRNAPSDSRFCSQHEKMNASTPNNEPPAPEPLTDPGVPIMLTVRIDADGNGQTRYLMPPEEAVVLLRGIADQIEQETAS